jgi:hypothetical protein
MTRFPLRRPHVTSRWFPSLLSWTRTAWYRFSGRAPVASRQNQKARRYRSMGRSPARAGGLPGRGGVDEGLARVRGCARGCERRGLAHGLLVGFFLREDAKEPAGENHLGFLRRAKAAREENGVHRGRGQIRACRQGANVVVAVCRELLVEDVVPLVQGKRVAAAASGRGRWARGTRRSPSWTGTCRSRRSSSLEGAA